MEKKYQKLYIWSFIIISGIILAMLYTPLGGNLHDSTFGSYDNYTTPGVNFHGKIGNAPKNGRTNQTRNYNDAMPVNSGTAYSVLSKPVVIGNSSTSQSNFQNGNYQGGGLNFNKTNSGMNNGSAGSGGTGLIALGGGRSGGSSTGGGSFSGGGLFSSTAPSATNEGVMQKASNDLDDLADPGGGDPTGDPIPAGDGFYLLILFCVVYAFIKFRHKRNTITH